MSQVIISREDARAAGLRHFFDCAPCRRGHTVKRYVSSGSCFRCVDERQVRDRTRNRADVRQYMAVYRDANSDAIRAQRALYRAAKKAVVRS